MADLKKLAEELVNLTVKEVNELAGILAVVDYILNCLRHFCESRNKSLALGCADGFLCKSKLKGKEIHNGKLCDVCLC